MTNATKTIATKMEGNIAYAYELGIDTNINWFNTILECSIESEGITFENANAQAFFIQAVIKQIDKNAYYTVFPKIGMDERGNYTTDLNKWA